eukprot:84623_1
MNSFLTIITLLLTYVSTVVPEDTIIWSQFFNLTCNNPLSSIVSFYGISVTECNTKCLTMYPMECSMTTWYQYIRPTEKDVSRCYLFGKTCDLVAETTKPVITSMWYYDDSDKMSCFNYPGDWRDIYLDNCGTYSTYSWCNQAYNSSTTAILSYQDHIYGLDATRSCCDCSGGLVSYDSIYLLEPIWKSSGNPNIHPSDDTICQSVDVSSTLISDIDIEQKYRFNLTQFVGLCEEIHSSLYNQYKLLLSINTDNNELLQTDDILSDFAGLKHFDCAHDLYLHNITICNDTDYNNFYLFLMDIGHQNIYINKHYINTESFLYHLPPSNVHTSSFCSFATFLNSTPPIMDATLVQALNSTPTVAPRPTLQPTIFHTLEPSSSPESKRNIMTSFLCETTAVETMNPTRNPSIHPTRHPTAYPT